MTAATLLLLLCWPIVAAEQSYGALPLGQCPTVAHVMRSAEKLCGGAPVADSLWSIGIRDGGAAAEELLKQHGLRTALDLRVLRDGGPDETELMEHLRAGGISIGDRSKVRLLLREPADDCGGTRRLPAPLEVEPVTTMESSADPGLARRRQLQQETGGMSLDTVAIVLSVLVGAAGYLVQVCGAGSGILLGRKMM